MLVIVIGKIAIAATIAMAAKATMMIGSLELLISYPQFGQNLLWAVSCSLHFGQVLSVDFPQSVQNASFSLIYALSNLLILKILNVYIVYENFIGGGFLDNE